MNTILKDEQEGETWLTRRIYKVSVRLTAPVCDAALRLLDLGAYLILSELVNDVLRRRFEERGIELETFPISAGLPIPMKEEN